ncbi:MAG: tetratricopeptide repeat protein [Candidatus Acidiferrales bacterium]
MPCVIAIFACAVCVSAQSASVSSPNTSASSTSVANAGSPVLGDASVSVPSTGSGASGNSSSGASLRTDPYSTFDAGNNSIANLRRMMYEDTSPQVTVSAMDSINQEDCGTWTQIGVHSATVSMVRLEVPGKARGIYQKACSELKKKKLDDARRDAEKALTDDGKYPAAWVLLGQLYYNTSDMANAHEACSKAVEIDPGYVAPYLCLAAIADRQQNWDDAQKLSDQALRISPLKNTFALYYKAEAAFHKQDLPGAEKNALDAAGADNNHQLPEVELLLARIYSAMKKSDEAAVRVRKYLKFSHEPDGPAAVSAQLAAISTVDTGQAK